MSLRIDSETPPESIERIKSFLHSQYSGVLATVDSDNNPHAAAIYFSLEDDFSIVFATKNETRKYKNIQENHRVAFVVYNEQDQATVQITGRADVIDDPDLRQKAINNMFRSSAERSQIELPPAEKIWEGDYVALRLTPNTLRMAVYARPDSGGDDIFESLHFSED